MKEEKPNYPQRHHHHDTNHLQGKSLLWVTLLNLSITIVQIIGGLISNSLSLLSDAIHNLGDSSAIFIAFIAAKISRKEPNEHFTFGYKRAEILAAFFNSVVLIAICIFLVVEAFHRFVNPQPVHGKLMLFVASFGLLANLVSVLVLNKDKEHSLNVKAAYLHLLGDTISSVAVIAGGLAIWQFGIVWIDPLITLLVAVYIVFHTWRVLKETVNILMQSTPENINLVDIKTDIEKVKGVENIHHVHVWKLTDKETHLEAHLNLKQNVSMSEMMNIKQIIEKMLIEKFGIGHITLQTGYGCCNGEKSLIINKAYK
ncbi:MAG: cation diffusion facilitator family transporter [Bacteroidales bacterium]|nr:cation diffusion facilitator family transporter [Bacteroidales bacterium]